MDADTKGLVQELKRRRKRLGFSGEKLRDLTLPHYPYEVSGATIARVLRGEIPADKVDPLLLQAMSIPLKCAVDDLSPVVAAKLGEVRELVLIGESNPPIEQGEASFGCTGVLAGQAA